MCLLLSASLDIVDTNRRLETLDRSLVFLLALLLYDSWSL